MKTKDGAISESVRDALDPYALRKDFPKRGLQPPSAPGEGD